jgi:hypothetical protein
MTGSSVSCRRKAAAAYRLKLLASLFAGAGRIDNLNVMK